MTTMVSGGLNPNAAVYVPVVAYGEVEDFSAEWWELVKSSSWFRDYWLSVCHLEEDEDLETLFEEMVMLAEAEEKSVSDWSFGGNDHVGESKSFNGLKVDVKSMLKDIVVPKSPKQRNPKSPGGPAKYRRKTAPFVTPKSAPRRIHQPR